MWSRRGALLAALALAACGFTPAYAPGGAGARLQGQVSAADPRTADDYAFVRRFEERMGTPAAPRYALAYRLRVAPVAQAITADDVTTRYSLNGTASYTLTDSASGATLARGEVSAFSGTSALGTPVATVAAERDAHDRLAVMLADQVATRLIAALAAHAPAAPAR